MEARSNLGLGRKSLNWKAQWTLPTPGGSRGDLAIPILKVFARFTYRFVEARRYFQIDSRLRGCVWEQYGYC